MREAAGITGELAAAAIGASGTSRAESGGVPGRPQDVVALMDLHSESVRVGPVSGSGRAGLRRQAVTAAVVAAGSLYAAASAAIFSSASGTWPGSGRRPRPQLVATVTWAP